MNRTIDTFNSSFNDLRSTTSNKRLSKIFSPDFEENDDNQEKKAQNNKNSAMLKLGLNTNTNLKPNETIKSSALNPEQISHHYGDCMKLASENKITSKNAFDLHLIDYLQDYMHSLQSFQVVSSSLDAGAKIYAGRVDLVHTNTYHILTSCGTSQNDERPDEPILEDKDNNEDHQDEIKNKKTKKRQEHNKKLTCTNLRKIRLTSAQIRSEVDPLFQSQAKKFDEGGTGELRLNNLKLMDDNFGLLLDFDSVVTTKCCDYLDNDILNTMFDINEFTQMFYDISQKPVPISTEFDGFKFTGWDSKNDIMNSQAAESFRNLTHQDDSVKDNEGDGGYDCGYDDDYLMDHDDININIENANKIKEDENVVMINTLEEEENDDHMLTIGDSKNENGTSVYVSSIKEMINSFLENYGERNDNILGMWAGPDHWKQKSKPIKTVLLPGDRPRTVKPGKLPKVVKPMFPDKIETQYDDMGIGRLVNITYEDADARDPRVCTQLTDVCLNKNIKKEYILPPRTQFAFRSINQLMNREVSLVNKALKKHAEQLSCVVEMTGDQGVNISEKNNDNDIFEMMPKDMVVIDDDGNVSNNANDCADDGGDYFDDDPYTGNSMRNCNFDDFGDQNQGGDNVRRPETVDINYAKTAKRINVKKLKHEIKSYLADNIHTLDIEVVTSKKYPDVHLSSQYCKLSNLLVTVDRNVSSDVSKELSVSILMTCLLHLANEMGLDISNEEDFSDFVLGQGFSKYDLEQIGQFGVGNPLCRDSRKRRTIVADGDSSYDSNGDGGGAVASSSGPVSNKRRQSLFSDVSFNGDDSD